MEYKTKGPKKLSQALKVALYLCAKRASKIIVQPMEMLLSLSIGTFLTNYDVTDRKL